VRPFRHRAGPGRARTVATATVLAAALVLPALAGAARTDAAGSIAAGTPAAGVDRPVTPLLSVRRLAGWITDSVARDRFAAALPGIMARLGPAATTSCLVVSQGDQIIDAEHPSVEVLPASNMKLLTATAVLEKLGAGLRITTTVTASAPPRRGTVHGNLYLIGAGDPFLWTASYVTMQIPPQPLYTSMPALAAEVRAAGITRITGSVIGDETLFDTKRGVSTWLPIYREEGDVGPLSALEVDNGFSLTPPLGYAAQPAAMAAGVLTTLLRADGVKVHGPAQAGAAPASAVPVTSITSAPLGRIVDAVLRVSDDTGAELLTKLLGKHFGGVGSTAAGVKVIRADLAGDGLPVAGLRAADGSGLDRDDRVTCALIDADLRHVGPAGPLFPGLPIAGQTGTLAPRFRGTPAAGRLHAKTGTLDGVAALSGFVLPARGDRAPTASLRAPIAFSFITNGAANPTLADAVGDAIGVHLAGAFKVPPLADALPLAPRAPAP
jgi:D-alanyl-D-alanine carboxypeptidase/D-alanyl-D-alanine-endopeptidase (penicillin-binding protein 4)